MLGGLTAGRLDLLLLAVPLGIPGVVELPLYDEHFVLVTPLGHPLGGQAGIPRESLKELTLLLLDEGHCLRDQALDICREAGRGIKGAGRSPSAEGGGGRREGAPVTTTAAGLATLVQLVAGGLGCTLLPHTAVRVETSRSDRLLTGSFAEPAPSRRIALAMRAGAARGTEYREPAAALREALRPLPVRVLGADS
ncbi:LysR substrate-binding domain-containing protein [Streptomyces sp. NPDC058683]|uniref:LysR substrate-binding domain-containing protein n=1 Tax=Streptomyces sp. NPDC058683 TaxID=3346597 RepID=UPI00364911D1